MLPTAVRLIFVYFASLLLLINLVRCQMQSQGGQPQQFQHKFAYGAAYAYKWEVPFTYTYTIPPFSVDANQYKPAITQVQPQQLNVGNYQSPSNQQPSSVLGSRFPSDENKDRVIWEAQMPQQSSTQQQQQPSVGSRFQSDENEDRIIWEVQKPQQSSTQQQQQPSFQSPLRDDDAQQVTTGQPQQQTEQIKVPLLDDLGRQIGWMYSWVDKQNIHRNSFPAAPSLGSESGLSSGGFDGGLVSQSTESTPPIQTTEMFPTDSSSGSSYLPQSSTAQNTPLRQNSIPQIPTLPSQLPPPIQESIKQIQQTELSQQPTLYQNSYSGLQTAGGASGAAPVPSKMCTAQQISSNLCPGAGFTGAHPSVSGVNFLTGQQSQDIDSSVRSLQQGMLQLLSSVHQKARFTPVYTSGDTGGPAVVVGASVSGGPGGGIYSYTFAKA